MAFFLERCNNGTPTGYLFRDIHGADLSYENGQDAAAHVRRLNEQLAADNVPIRWKVTSVKVAREESTVAAAVGDSSDWRERERTRMTDGTYTPVPWIAESWYALSDYCGLHFPHMSKDRPGMVAFTESEEKGAADRQLRIRAGKYLTRYFGDKLSEESIREWSAEVSIATGDFGVNFADTPDEIERVYLDGPSSCMSKSPSYYESPCHPVRVYGAGDLAVAYYQTDDSIAARTLCWPEKKVYGRVYGDGGRYEQKLIDALESMGFDDCGDMDGARLLRIEHGGAFVCPYLDCSDSISDDGKFLRIGGGEFQAEQTDGLCEGYGELCSYCGERFDSDNEGGYLESHDMRLCDSCWGEITFYCEDCSESHHTDNGMRLHNGEVVCDGCANEYPMCAECNDLFPSDDVIHIDSNSESVCESCYDRCGYFRCESCEETFDESDHESRGHDDFCHSCAADFDAENAESEDDESEDDAPRHKLGASYSLPINDADRAAFECEGQLRLEFSYGDRLRNIPLSSRLSLAA